MRLGRGRRRRCGRSRGDDALASTVDEPAAPRRWPARQQTPEWRGTAAARWAGRRTASAELGASDRRDWRFDVPPCDWRSEYARAQGRVDELRAAFPAYGQRRFVTLGTDEGGWTPKRPRRSCATRWRASTPASGGRKSLSRSSNGRAKPVEPTLHRFASDWLEARRGQLRENAYKDYLWRLTHRLLPFFRLQAVGHRRRARGPLPSAQARRARGDSPTLAAGADTTATSTGTASGHSQNRWINMTLTLLGAILETAVEYERAPAWIQHAGDAGASRRPTSSRRSSRPARSHARSRRCRQADREARADRKIGRPGDDGPPGVRREFASASWAVPHAEHVDLGNRKLYVPTPKTPSGVPPRRNCGPPTPRIIESHHPRPRDEGGGVAAADNKREASQQGQRQSPRRASGRGPCARLRRRGSRRCRAASRTRCVGPTSA